MSIEETNENVMTEEEENRIIEESMQQRMAEASGREKEPSMKPVSDDDEIDDDESDGEGNDSDAVSDNEEGGDLASNSSPEENSTVDESNTEDSVSDPANEQPTFAGYTEAQIKEAFELIPKLRKSLDSTNGRYGSELQQLKKEIEALRTGGDNGPDEELTADSFANLKEDFPDLAEMLAKDLSTKLGRRKGGSPSIDIEAIKSELMSGIEQRLTFERLDSAHPDWRNEAGYDKNDNGIIVWNNPKFGNWVASQDVDFQRELLTSNDAKFLAKALTDYKSATDSSTGDSSKDSSKGQNTAFAGNTKVNKSVSKAARLEKAAVPKGSAGQNNSALSDDEIIAREFAKRMKKNVY